MTAVAPPDVLLFDWDNTLIETWPVIHDALHHTFEAMGVTPWTMEETRVRVRHSMRDSFPKLFGEDWERAAEIFYARFREIHMELLTPIDGAGEMLEAAHGLGYVLGVVSNKRGEFLRAEAEHLGWAPFFSRLVGAMDASRDKPAVEAVHLALSGSGFGPGENIWLVGDTDIDLECAANAGCTGILVRETPPSAGEFDAHPPAWYFSSCNELSTHLAEMKGRDPGGNGAN